MSETPDTNETPAPLSRRDFLRRTGKEAAQNGAKFVPGVALAQAVLGTGEVRSGETDPNVARQPSWMRRLLHWKADRAQGPSDIAEGTHDDKVDN